MFESIKNWFMPQAPRRQEADIWKRDERAYLARVKLSNGCMYEAKSTKKGAHLWCQAKSGRKLNFRQVNTNHWRSQEF